MNSSAHLDAKIEVENIVIESSDDTDYEELNDYYSELDAEVLEVHLNCSDETGKTVLSVGKDVEVVEEKYQEINRDLQYDSSKYFLKTKAALAQNRSKSRVKHSDIRVKKIKMDNDKEEVIIISSDEEDKDVAEDVVPSIDGATETMSDEMQTVDRQDILGFRDREQLSKLERVRRWKHTGLGTALLSGEKKLSPSDTKFRVLSYNILAQTNLTGHQNLYRGKPQYLLEWDYRWSGIQREINTFNPDIVTFQEVQFSGPDHFSEQIKPWFTQLGFEDVSQRRTGDKQDGCAIFFRKDMFNLMSSRGILYKQNDVPLLDKDNIGLVCCLRTNTGSRLVVATTHLLFNPKRHDIRLAQTALLLTELDRIAWDKNKRSYVPVILTGDLNTQPFSDTYNLITRGHVRYAGLQCGRSVLPAQLLPPSLGVADTCQWVTELADRGVAPSMGTGEFSHIFGFRSVYNHSRYLDSRVPVGGYEATTFHSTWVTVDYIYYSTIISRNAASNDGKQEGKLKLVGRLSLPTGPEISVLGGLPSLICPSDHLFLLAEFILKV